MVEIEYWERKKGVIFGSEDLPRNPQIILYRLVAFILFKVRNNWNRKILHVSGVEDTWEPWNPVSFPEHSLNNCLCRRVLSTPQTLSALFPNYLSHISLGIPLSNKYLKLPKETSSQEESSKSKSKTIARNANFKFERDFDCWVFFIKRHKDIWKTWKW